MINYGRIVSQSARDLHWFEANVGSGFMTLKHLGASCTGGLRLSALAGLALWSFCSYASDGFPEIAGAKVVSKLITLVEPTDVQLGVSDDRNYVYVVAQDVALRKKADRPKYGANVALNSRFSVFDIRDSQHPKSAGPFKLSAFEADFGRWIGNRLCFHVMPNDHGVPLTPILSNSDSELLVFDVSQPLKPKLLHFSGLHSPGEYGVPFECSKPATMPPSIEQNYNTVIDGQQAVFLDRSGTKDLVGRNGEVEIWKSSDDPLPIRSADIRKLNGGGLSTDFRLLSTDGEISASFLYRNTSTQKFSTSVVVLHYDKPSLDWSHLVAVHRLLLASYVPGQSKAENDAFARQLANAGGSEVLARKPHLVSEEEEARILNDWGFWASKGSDPAKAIPILQRVVAIEPQRLVAWKNLADAAAAAVFGSSGTDELLFYEIEQKARARVAELSAK